MSSRHGNSRRQAYGRRMKDLRTRGGTDLEIDLEGPNGWSRGAAWEGEQTLHRAAVSTDRGAASVRAR